MSHYDPIDASARARLARLSPWRRRLFLFLRGVSAFLILEGVLNWAVILGLGSGDPSRFETLSIMAQGAVVLAGIVNPVAGVGLWLRANWAVAFWLIAALCQIALSLWAPAHLLLLSVFMVVEVGLMIAYGVLLYRVWQEKGAN